MRNAWYYRVLMLVASVLALPTLVLAQDSADDGTMDHAEVGAGEDKPAILFIGVRARGPLVDEHYGDMLEEAGFVYTKASGHNALTYDFLKQFNVIVLDRLPMAHGENVWVYGWNRMLAYWYTMENVWRCMEEGAGVLVYPHLVGRGRPQAAGWNMEMEPWGVQIEHALVRDTTRRFAEWTSWAENFYSWTTDFADHPLTEGLERFYYVCADHRAWMECYSTPPLRVDDHWTPLVYAEPEAHLATQVDGTWYEEPNQPEQMVLAAVRDAGEGRLAAMSLNPKYTHRHGYRGLEGRGRMNEATFGPVSGKILEIGDGDVESDTGELLLRLYRWLAADSADKGFGGYQMGDPIGTAPRGEWRRPRFEGDTQHFKALIGARSTLSDGESTVPEMAAAARDAGYSMIAFTETFEHLSPEDWETLVAQCERVSNDGFIAIPGYDIQDPYGNHLLIVGPPQYPRWQWLNEDRDRIVKTHMLNLPFYQHTVVAHRVSQGNIPHERLQHNQGISIYTYEGGEKVNEDREAYQWLVQSGSNPLPYAVHEVRSASEVRQAATHGFQQILEGDTLVNAVDYFRFGEGRFFNDPPRFQISEGPIIETWNRLAPERGHQRWPVELKVRSDADIREVTMYDGTRPFRRWLDKASPFKVEAHPDTRKQHNLYFEVEDADGRRAMSATIWIRTWRRHFRASDRQNWLGHIGYYYPGALLPHRFDMHMPIEGTQEARRLFPNERGKNQAIKLHFPFTNFDVVLTEFEFGETYIDANWDDVKMDGTPAQPSEPAEVYEGVMRYWSFTPFWAGVTDETYPVLIELDLRLKRDVEPRNVGGLFPRLGRPNVPGNDRYWYVDDAGEVRKDEVAGETFAIPVGGMAGGIIALSDNLQIRNGHFGVAYPAGEPEVLPEGTEISARFLLPSREVFRHRASRGFHEDTRQWLELMGLLDETPYEIELTRGEFNDVAFLMHVELEDHGIAGEVTQSAEDSPYLPPFKLEGVNENWSAGVWQRARNDNVNFTGVFENTAYPRITVGAKGERSAFYAGNLILADNERLQLEIIRWDDDGIEVEAHNPTSETIDTTIWTPEEVDPASYLPLERERVTVPAGSTIYILNERDDDDANDS